MPITNVIGVPWNNIVSIGGVYKTSIINMAGVPTPPIYNCITVYYGFSDGRMFPPEDSCTSSTQPYDFDPVNQVLFNFGTCGFGFAEPGYYSDGTTIFSWRQTPEGVWKWLVYSDCVVPGPINDLPPSFTPAETSKSQVIGSKGIWTTTGTVSFIYEWYSDSLLIFTQTSPLFNPKTGEWEDIEPFLNLNYDWLFTAITLKVICTDDTGTTSVTSDPDYYNDLDLDIFLLNSGINSVSTINALQYLQKELRVKGYYDYYLIDFYPLVGSTESEMKWSLKNPNNFLNFSPGWSFSFYGAQGSSTYNGVGTWADSNFQFNLYEPINFAYYTPTPVVENSYDLSIILNNTDNNTLESVLTLQTKNNLGGMYFGGPNGSQVINNPYDPIGLIGVASVFPSTPPSNFKGFVQNNLLGDGYPVFGGYTYPYFVRVGAGMNGNSIFPPLAPSSKLYQFVLVGRAFGVNNMISDLNSIIAQFQILVGRSL